MNGSDPGAKADAAANYKNVEKEYSEALQAYEKAEATRMALYDGNHIPSIADEYEKYFKQ